MRYIQYSSIFRMHISYTPTVILALCAYQTHVYEIPATKHQTPWASARCRSWDTCPLAPAPAQVQGCWHQRAASSSQDGWWAQDFQQRSSLALPIWKNKFHISPFAWTSHRHTTHRPKGLSFKNCESPESKNLRAILCLSSKILCSLCGKCFEKKSHPKINSAELSESIANQWIFCKCVSRRYFLGW